MDRIGEGFRFFDLTGTTGAADRGMTYTNPVPFGTVEKSLPASAGSPTPTSEPAAAIKARFMRCGP